MTVETPLPPLILVVDDEPDIVTYLTMMLEDAGYRTRFASSAEAALVALRLHRPDLVTLDIMMPRRSGISLYREIKTDAALRAIPAIVVSAFSRLEDFTGERFRRLVPDPEVPEPLAFIEKPVVPELFLATVAGLVGASDGDDR